MLRVAVLGSSGMAGHVLTEFLRQTARYDVLDIGPRQKVWKNSMLCDIHSESSIEELIVDVKPDVLINCMGVLINASEAMKIDAVWVNAYIPHLLNTLCERKGIRLIHLSTDCVFSGVNGPYNENSYRDGDRFYDRSKALGELLESDSLTIRTSIIGPELRKNSTGLLEWVLGQKGEVKGYRKALWSGVTTLELAKFIDYTISKNEYLKGIVHYSVQGGISKYELLELINNEFSLGLRVVPVDVPVLDKRLVNTRMDLGMAPSNYPKQIHEIRSWIDSRRELYLRIRE